MAAPSTKADGAPCEDSHSNICLRPRPPLNLPDRPVSVALSLRFLSLNCGGLSQDLYVELLKALEAMPAQTQPQIVALQETHWSSDSAQQYTTGAWQVVQSHRHDNRSAGVMFLVHRSLTQHAVLSFGEPFPGRILHVRITAKGWALDCVNVYQQTMNWQRPAKDVVKPGEPKPPTTKFANRSGPPSIKPSLNSPIGTLSFS